MPVPYNGWRYTLNVDGDVSKSDASKVRLRQGAFWVVVSLVVIALAMIGAVLCYKDMPKPLVPTGDPLLDRYVAAVWERTLSQPATPTELNDHPRYSALADVVEWEAEYSSDPKYWQLRYVLDYSTTWFSDICGTPGHAFADALAQADPPPASVYAESTSSDPETQWLLYQFQLAQERDLNDVLILVTIIDALGDKLSPETRVALTNTALEADPADPRAQWRWGLTLLEEGEYEQALDYFKRSNASHRPRSSQLFPQDEINTILGKGDLLGNAEISARLTVLDLSSGTRELQMEVYVKELLTSGLAVEQPEVFQELSQSILRMAEAGNLLDVFVTLILLKTVVRATSEALGDDLTAEQQDTIDRIDAVRDQISWHWLQTSKSNTMPSDLVRKIPVLGELKSTEWVLDSTEAEYEMLETDIRPLIRLLMEVDFTTLETPPGLVGFEWPYPNE